MIRDLGTEQQNQNVPFFPIAMDRSFNSFYPPCSVISLFSIKSIRLELILCQLPIIPYGLLTPSREINEIIIEAAPDVDIQLGDI